MDGVIITEAIFSRDTELKVESGTSQSQFLISCWICFLGCSFRYFTLCPLSLTVLVKRLLHMLGRFCHSYPRQALPPCNKRFHNVDNTDFLDFPPICRSSTFHLCSWPALSCIVCLRSNLCSASLFQCF